MRYAICNETFEGWDHARICRVIADLGYTGLEIAPFTLAPRVTDFSAADRQMFRKQAEDCGVQIIGLHWLLAKTEGFQITSPQEEVRARTAEYLVDLARCCRDLGGSLLVFGSPAQRRIPPGHSVSEAADFAVETMAAALPGIADAGVRLCLEPLAPAETDFIQTASEAVTLLERLDHPNCLLHLDVKAMASDEAPPAELIRRHADRLAHVHANDPNRRGPGFGETDFVPIFRALHDIRYSGWVSMEVFDFTPDPETIARESIRYMRTCAEQAASLRESA